MGVVQKYCKLKTAFPNRESVNYYVLHVPNEFQFDINWLIYGSSGHGRFATKKHSELTTTTLYDFSDPGSTFTRELYNKEYELKDHLGNVRLVFSDLKLRTNDTTFDLDIRAVNNYYPFGMLQPGRYWQSGDYRYGFNGMEKDDEIKGVGNSLDFGARIYDSRLGRWLSRDQEEIKFPFISTYSSMSNNPIIYVDEDGKIIKIKLTGSMSDEAIFTNLQKLTNDKLELDTKTEIVTVIPQEPGKLRYGTALIQELNDPKFTVTIEYTPDPENSSGAISTEDDFKAEKGIKLKEYEIHFNPDLKEGGLNVEGKTDRPSEIGLGHELIHSKAAKEGKLYEGFRPKNDNQLYEDVDPNSKGKILRTNEIKARKNENKLREEQGVPLRVIPKERK